MAVALIEALVTSGDVSRVVVVGPQQALSHWQREFGAVAPALSVVCVDNEAQVTTINETLRRVRLVKASEHLVALVSYGVLASGSEKFTAEGGKVCLVIADEAHLLKNH